MSIPSPQAFSPGSATLIFLPVRGLTVEETFAQGAAIALEDGVTAAVRSAPTPRVVFNGEEIELPPVSGVVEALAPEPVEVFLETSLPLGCGFGVSAGCALTTTFALARRFEVDLPREELGMIAHRAEVGSGTGIGDVCTQLSGGVVFRRGESGPFDVVRMPLDNVELYYRIFGPLSTKEVLASAHFQQLLKQEGERGMEWLREHHETTSLGAVLDRSLEFAERTDLLTELQVRSAIHTILEEEGKATMVMLGQSVLATQPPAGESDWRSCRVSAEGTRWL